MPQSLRQKSFASLAATQFLGALNDNAYRQFILLIAIDFSLFGIPGGSIAMALFTIPFIIFSLMAGSMADRVSKQRVIVRMKILEIVVMALGTAAFAIGIIDLQVAIGCSLIVLFLMGAQSAFFGPSKYGIIPEIVPEAKLTQANGVINLLTQTAIVGGVIVAGELNAFINEHELKKFTSGAFFVSAAVIGWALSLGIRKIPAADPSRKIDKNLLAVPRHAWQEFRFLAKDRELLAASLAHSWFFLIGALALMVFNVFGPEVLAATTEVLVTATEGLSTAADERAKDLGGSYLLAAVGLGIAAGSPIAGFVSRKRPELGLVPFAAIGMSVCFAISSRLESFWAIHGLIFSAGIFGGVYIVPLSTFIQERPNAQEKGRTLGANATMNFIFIACSAVIFAIMTMLGMTGAQMVFGLGALLLLGSALSTFIAPIFLQRAILLLVRTLFYRVHVVGQENVPMRGGALFVSNHISYADPVLVAAGCPRLPRFLMHRSFSNFPVIGFITRLLRVIPIADTDGPRALLRSLDDAADHISTGQPAGIFAEGSISRTGNLLPFSRGLERIAKRADCPVIPVYLDRVWGSLFSFHRGRSLWNLPNRLPYRVTVAFGKPLAPDTPVHEIREAMQNLSAVALDARRHQPETLATRFVTHLRRHSRRFCMGESTGRRLSRRQTLIASLLLRGLLADRVRDQKFVGVLLPSGLGGALTNIALTLLGKVPVNLNYTAGKEAFESSKEQCQLETIVTSPKLLEKLGLADDPRHVFLEDILGGATRWQKLRAAATALLPAFCLRRLKDLPQDPDAMATVIFSSGSTGDPKGVCLSHHNVLSNTRSINQVLNSNKDDCIVGILPFFHSLGFTATIWLPLLHGFAVAYHNNPMDAKPIAKLIRTYRCTVLLSTPTFFQGYLRRFEPEDIETLRLTGSGAEKLKASLRERWREKFGVDIHEAYGCTELSPAVTINLPDVTRGDVHQVAHKPGTVGHPFPGVAVRIVHPETGDKLDPNEEGMLLVSGPATMQGYLNRPDLTEEVFRDGWYVTGDIARMDPDGFVTITGRLSRFSKIGGEMVPHIRVEEVIQAIVDGHQEECRIDEEDNCMEVAVTSVPSEEKGEKLVVLHTPLSFPIDDLYGQLKETELPRLWVPRKSDFVEVPAIPKLGSGKLDLKAIGQLALDAEA